MVPSEVESKGSEQQIRQAIWLAEVATALFKPGLGAVTMLVDFGGSASSKKYVGHMSVEIASTLIPLAFLVDRHYRRQDR